MKIGLEAISFYTSEYYVDLVELAKARNIAPEKFTQGLGTLKMSVASPLEDTVHFAINAGEKLLKSFRINPDEIGMLVVGTETGVDHSKPVAVYVHQALGLPSNCLTYETKHACFGATAAIASASDWLISGRAKNKKALIVAADIANYAVQSAGEPTQGAGAVAMVVSANPTLVEFLRDISGNFAKNVMDFWRPLYSKEAITDGHYSIDCYLDSLEACLEDAGEGMPRLSDLSGCLYHVPFPKMAAKAHMRHYEIDYGTKIEKDTPDYSQFQQSFNAKTKPWLSLNAHVGNVYTGSLFLSLMDLLRQGKIPAGEQISFFSYGSGCAASLSVLQLCENYRSHQRQLCLLDHLNARTQLSIEEYEDLMAERNRVLSENDKLKPQDWNLSGRYLYLGNKEHIRQYSNLN